MKFILYVTATFCLMLSAAIASNGRSTQVVLPDGAPAALSQTGVLPVQVQEQNQGLLPASFLAIIGIGLATYGSVDLRPKPNAPTAIPLEQELNALLDQSARGALLDPNMEAALHRHYGTQWRTRLGLPIPIEGLTVELPPELQQEIGGSGTSKPIEGGSTPKAKQEPKPATKSEPKPEPRAVDPRFNFLFELVDAPCIRIYGPQGSGKSSKLAWFGLEHVKRGDRVMVINPMARAGDFKGLKVFGKGMDYKEAEQGISEFTAEAKRRLRDRGLVEDYDPLINEPHWSLLCDEMSDWGEWVDPSVMNELIGVQQQFLRQANMSVRQVSHGDTNAMNGGAAMNGRKTAMNRQFIKFETSAMHDPTIPGKLRCAGKALLHRPDRTNPVTIDIPVWMQAPPNHDFRQFMKLNNVVQLKA